MAETTLQRVKVRYKSPAKGFHTLSGRIRTVGTDRVLIILDEPDIDKFGVPKLAYRTLLLKRCFDVQVG